MRIEKNMKVKIIDNKGFWSVEERKGDILTLKQGQYYQFEHIDNVYIQYKRGDLVSSSGLYTGIVLKGLSRGHLFIKYLRGGKLGFKDYANLAEKEKKHLESVNDNGDGLYMWVEAKYLYKINSY